jgi:alkanesulfonate monooxygenase SsuD/methylene tetrahydromethanopterin reductase-like flavin-dependent oxidoreductase (luciferase family)
LFVMSAVLDETDEGARGRQAHIAQTAASRMEYRLAFMSYASGVDFSKFDLDAPVPDVRTNAAQASTAALTTAAGKKTLREIVCDPATGGFDFVGSPDAVAAQMDETMMAIGGDGFLVNNELTRRNIAEVTDGLAPALRQRGLIRSTYGNQRLRDNLREF